MIERLVDLAGHDTRIAGDDNDDYVKHLPAQVHEAALECASALLGDDAVVLDVGANVGVLAIGFARIAHRGRVIAIEPSPRTFPYLVQNVEAAGVEHVDTLQVAASDVPGSLEFFDSGWFSAGSFVKQEKSFVSELDMHASTVSVPAEPIDAIVERLGLRSVDFVKVDVEGHELPALRGARSTLNRFRPTAFVELNFFATTSFGNTLPFDFLGDICATFPCVYDFSLDDGLEAIVTEQDMYKCVQRQFLTGRPSDLVCTFEPLRDDVQADLERRCTRAQPDGETNELHAELATLREQLTSIQAALDEARQATTPARRFGERFRRSDR